MKIRISKADLATATSRVQGVMTEKNMSYLGLSCKAGVLTVYAADRLMAVYSDFSCETLKDGKVFVSSKLLSEIVRELPQAVVELETVDSMLILRSEGESEFEMKLPIIDDAVWQDPPELTGGHSAELPASKLAYLIDQVSFCVGAESSRNYGSVGYLHSVDGNRLRLVGTDGFRLSYCEFTDETASGLLQKGACISKRALNELARLSHEGFETIQLHIAEEGKTLRAAAPGYLIQLRLSAVEYPNYQSVVPTDHPLKIKIPRTQLQGIVKRMLIAADKSKALQLSFSTSSLTLSSKTKGGSEARESVYLKDSTSADCDFVVNGRFLTDVFSTTHSGEVQFQFNDAKQPIVVIPEEEPAGCVSRHVLVPIRES